MLYYKIGDATAPEGEGKKIIAHVCNDVGGWGRGFVLAISKRWPEPEEAFRAWHTAELGQVLLVTVGDDLHVANMVAQHDVRTIDGVPPIRYPALRECLKTVNDVAKDFGATIHMPRIGCGLAGGKWELVEKIITEVVTADVFVYDIPDNKIPWK